MLNFNYTENNSEAIIINNLTIYNVYVYEMWQRVLFASFIIPVILLSITGNIFVITAIIKKPYLQTNGNIFLASLAVADCTIAIVVMPLNAHQLLFGNWYLKSFTCRFLFSCDVFFSTASILHLFCVSVDRFLSTSNIWAFRYRAEDPMHSWRIRIMIASVWITSALLSFIPIFTDLFTTREHANIINNLDVENGLCVFVVNFPYRIVSSMISFWLPGIGMIIFYCLVMRKAYKCVKKDLLLQKQPSDKMNNDLLNHNSNFKNSKLYKDTTYFEMSKITYDENLIEKNVDTSIILKERKDKWNREYKALKTLGTVILVFCFCWFFFFLNYTLCNDDVFINCSKIFGKRPYIDDILFWIGYSNSMINPFLYNFTNQDFRRAFRSLLNLSDKKKSKTFLHNKKIKPKKTFS